MASGDRANTDNPWVCGVQRGRGPAEDVHLGLHRHTAVRSGEDRYRFGVVLSGAEGPDLAFGQQVLTSRYHVFGCGHGLSTAVQLIEPHRIQPEPAQASLALGPNRLRANIGAAAGAPALIDAEAELGGYGDRLSHGDGQRGQCPPDDPLGVSGAVGGRRVDQCDSCVDRRVQRADAFRVVDLTPPRVVAVEGERTAEGPRADADGRQLTPTRPQRTSLGSHCAHSYS